MRTAHQKITKDQIEEYAKNLHPSEAAGGNSAHYQNYLKHELGNKENKERVITDSIERVAKDAKLSQADKLTKMKELVKKEERKKKKRDSQLLESIKAKMTILQEVVGK